MGEILFAAKVAHMPSIYAGEPGVYKPMEGRHEEFRDGLRRMGTRMLETGVETILIVDTHRIDAVNFHVNVARRHQGLYTSDEQPHVIGGKDYSLPAVEYAPDCGAGGNGQVLFGFSVPVAVAT